MYCTTALRRFSCCPSLVGRGVIYEVCVRCLDPAIGESYTHWLTSHHVDEVLQFPGFNSAEILRDHKTHDVIVRYSLDSASVFDEYDSSDAAKKLRGDASQMFGHKFQASRRLLTSHSIHFK